MLQVGTGQTLRPISATHGWSMHACAHHVRLDQAHLKGPASMLDGGNGRGAGAAVVAADLDNVSIGLCDTGSHSANAGLSHQLHTDLGCRGRLQSCTPWLRR